jgi:hypothetical protein
VVSACACCAAGAAEDAALQLTLQKAVSAGSGEGRDFLVSLDVRGGKVVGGFGHAPRFNKMPAELDVKGLALAGGRLTGTLKASIAWDGWVPRDGKPVAADYRIDAAVAEGKVDGKWSVTNVPPREGALAGTCATPASDTELVRLTVACANAMDHQAKVSARGLKAVFVLKDGKGVAARAIPAGSIADVGCSMEVPKFDLKLSGGKLTGMFQVEVTPQQVSAGVPPVVYGYDVQGLVVGDGAGGTMAITKNGEALSDTARFIAAARRGAPPPMADCTYKVTLHHALGLGKFIDVYLASTGGKFTGGFASSPNFNNAMHTVDTSKLTVGEGKLTGDLGVTVQADPWIPRDHKPIPCAFALNAAVANGEITGRFKGTAGTNAVERALEGALDDKVKLDSVTGMTIRLENGLAGSGNHMARAFVSMDIRDGKVTGGSVGNNHDAQMKGTVTGGEFKLSGDEWALKTEFTLTGAGSATLGKYEATASGTFVGTMSAGTFRCAHESGRVKEGSFWAALKLGSEKR